MLRRRTVPRSFRSLNAYHFRNSVKIFLSLSLYLCHDLRFCFRPGICYYSYLPRYWSFRVWILADVSNSSCTKSQAAEFWYLSFEYIEKEKAPYFDCFGSALFPEMRDRQYETQFKQLHQPNLQDAWTGSEVPYLSPFVPWARRIGVSRKNAGIFWLNFRTYRHRSLHLTLHFFKTFVSYFSKPNFVVTWLNFQIFSNFPQ